MHKAKVRWPLWARVICWERGDVAVWRVAWPKRKVRRECVCVFCEMCQIKTNFNVICIMCPKWISKEWYIICACVYAYKHLHISINNICAYFCECFVSVGICTFKICVKLQSALNLIKRNACVYWYRWGKGAESKRNTSDKKKAGLWMLYKTIHV